MNWIWLNSKYYPDYQNNGADSSFCVAEFAKTIHVKREGKYVVKICADARYQLYINGKFISRGPATPGSDFGTVKMNYCYFDSFDFYAKKRININVLVTSKATALNEFTFGIPGLAVEITDKKNKVICKTDETWQSRKLNRFSDILNIDYTKKEDKKRKSGTIPTIHNEKEKPIRNLIEERIDIGLPGKTDVEPKTKKVIEYDFDKIYSAYPVIDFYCDGENIITLETYEIDKVGYIKETIKTALEIKHFSQMMRSAGHIKITIENKSDKKSVLKDAYILFSHYPVDYVAKFRTSDTLLNKIYDTCMHSLIICRQSLHLDSPTHQEPLACTGDYYIQALMEYYNIYDPSLTKFDIYRTAQFLSLQEGVMFHTLYSLIVPSWIYDYYMFTGEKDILLSSVKTIDILLERFDSYVDKTNGLIEKAPNYMFVDWILLQNDKFIDGNDSFFSHKNFDGYSLHHPPKYIGQSILCMFYYKALSVASDICHIIGKEDKYTEYKEKSEKLKENINKYFFDNEKKLYIGGLGTKDEVEPNQWLPKNENKKIYLKQSNVIAVLFGITKEEYRKGILEYVLDNLKKEEMQPYFYGFLLEALLKENMFEKYGFDLIKRYKSMLDKCDKGLAEAWESYPCDYSHAWAGSPAYILKKAISGFEIVTPGCKKIKIKPCFYGLDYVYLEIPTKHGLIKISNNNGKQKIKIPKGIKVE